MTDESDNLSDPDGLSGPDVSAKPTEDRSQPAASCPAQPGAAASQKTTPVQSPRAILDPAADPSARAETTAAQADSRGRSPRYPKPAPAPGNAPGPAAGFATPPSGAKAGAPSRAPARIAGLLAWAGLGVAAYQVFRRWTAAQADPRDSTPAPGPGRAKEPARPRHGAPPDRPADPVAKDEDSASELLELPEGSETMWVPGPGGSLRIAQHNPSGGVPLLFVHGLGGSLEQWAPLVRRLGPGLRAVAVDLPGHGGSDPLTEPSIADLASAVAAAADALDLRRFVLVGHSTGAAAAIELAGRARTRVAGLLLLDPNGDQSRLPAKDRQQILDSVRNDAHGELAWHFRQVLGSGSEVAAPEVVERAVLDQLEATRPQVLADTLRAALEFGPLPALGRFDGPVRLILSPLNDMPYSLHRLKPDLRMAVLPEAGHWLMIDHPDTVLELLEPLLDACRERLDSVH